jgi:ferredoxin
MKVIIKIDQKECLGCSFCSGLLPEIFELDEKIFKGKIKKDGNLIDGTEFELSEEQLKKIKEAAEGCPVLAIKLLE